MISGLLDQIAGQSNNQNGINQLLFDSLPIGLAVCDMEGNMAYVNQAYASIMGYSIDEVLVLSYWDVTPIEFEALEQVQLASLQKTGRYGPYEKEYIHKDGHRVPVRLSGVVIQSHSQDYIWSSAEDITERKNFEKNLQQARDELELRVTERTLELTEEVAERTRAEAAAVRANQVKSDFLSSMSHELRTPMNAILGFGQMLEYNPEQPLTKEQKTCVDHIMSGSRLLLELINQVLDLANIESGQMTISHEKIVLSEVCRECLRLIETSAEDRGLSIECDLGARHTIKADQTRFKQVLLNLLSNAVKYNREDGTVTLTSQDTPDNLVRISVSDTGIGITDDKQDGLFEPFNRLGWETSNIEGTGVGLTLTKQLVEAMGGHIGYESKAGKGSTFWIEFPTIEIPDNKRAERLDVSENDKYQEQHSTTATVLYIEDNFANLQLMEAIINRMGGISLISAHNAELGMSFAEEHQPDLILMDINLPGMDGIAAMKVLSTIDITRDIPVIAITAAAMDRDIERGKKAGFKAYLTKPFNVPEIVEAIKKELGM